MVTLDWQWMPGEANRGDGIDISACDAVGNRLALCVSRNDSQDTGCSSATTTSITLSATPAGAYLSAVAYNYGDTDNDPQLWIDNIRFVRANYDFECQASGSAFPPMSSNGDCEGVRGISSEVVPLACSVGMPSSGVLAARVRGEGFQTAPNDLVRPVAIGLSEVRMPLPTGTQMVSFDWKWAPGQTGSGDGVDISICDSAGSLLTLCVARNDSLDTSCTAVANFATTFSATPAGAYLSAVAFNHGNFAWDPTLWIDNVKTSTIPSFELVFSSMGPGTVRMDLNWGVPNSAYLAPITFVTGTFPNGWFYGIDISIADLFGQVAVGAPFFGVLDSIGHYGLPATGAYFNVPSGLSFCAVALNDLVSPSVSGNTLAGPVCFTVP